MYQNPYTTYTYDNKRFAFLSDYLRLLIVYKEGGIYFDVDVEVVRPIDKLLENQAFFGFETKDYINTGLGFGAEAGNAIVEAMIKEYDSLLDGMKGTIGCPILNTQALTKLGMVPNGEKQKVENAVIYPIECFNPYDDPTGRLYKTKQTYSIHWYAKSWMDKKTVLRSKLTKPLHRVLKFFGRSAK